MPKISRERKSPKAGIFEVLAVEDRFFVFFGNTFTIVFTYNCNAVCPTDRGEGNAGHPLAMPECILDKIIEYFFEQRICIDTNIFRYRS